MRNKIEYIQNIFLLIEKKKIQLFLLFFYFIFVAIIDLSGIAMIIPYINIVLGQSNTENFFYELILSLNLFDNITISLSLIIITIFIFRVFAAYFLRRQIVFFANNIRAELVQNFTNIYLSLNLNSLLKKNYSYIFNVCANYTSVFTSNCLIPLLKTMSEFIFIILASIYLININHKAFLVIIALLISFILFYHFIFRNYLYSKGKIAAVNDEKLIREIKESLRSWKILKSAGYDDYYKFKIRKLTNLISKTQTQLASVQILPKYLIETLFVIFFVTFTMYIISYNTEKNLSNILFAYGAVGIRLIPSAVSIIDLIINLKASSFAISELVNEKKYLNDYSFTKNTNKFIVKKINKISLENIFFSYDENKKLLSNINIDLQTNNIIGVFGESGTGKSTLINIIIGILYPNDGILKVNDKKISFEQYSNLNLSSYIPQDNFIAKDSIRNNIVLGNNDFFNEKHFKAVIELANLTKFIEQFKKKEDHVLEEDGSNLSGGQKQRIAIARALYHNKQILVLDEATVSLDTKNQDSILNSIKNLKDKIIIIVSHSREVLKICDSLYELKDAQLLKIK